MIPFNKPALIGKELKYIRAAVDSGKLSGDGVFSSKCHQFFEEEYHISKALLTTSCTDALEMASILLDIQSGDEVIAPSYTFVSSVNPFVLRGAKIVFADSTKLHPNIDVDTIEELITDKTKAIVVVHYAGIACDMAKVIKIAEKHGLYIIEDAAQAIDSYYNGLALGTIGDMGTFSFHETKNIIAGEGGLLAINNQEFIDRSEIIREKGTNRSAFFRGEVDKYGWVDIGSSFLPSELVSAYLWAQLENLEKIQTKRKMLWDLYFTGLNDLSLEGYFELPQIPSFATNNAHMFYVICKNAKERTSLKKHLLQKEILAVSHYISLHKSEFYKSRHDGRELPFADKYTDSLLRLPLFYDLSVNDIQKIIECVREFYL